MKIIKDNNIKDIENKMWKDYWREKGLERNHKDVNLKIVDNGKIIGVVSSIIEGGVLHVDNIIITERYRGKKIGHKIMEYLDNVAIKNKCHKIRLETSKEFMQNAYHLYKKYSFKEETIIKNDWFNKEWIILSKFIDVKK